MKKWVWRGLLVVAGVVAVMGGILVGLWYQRVKQVADPSFDASVARPAYPSPGPRVLFDEAHYNFHTASGRYRPFVALISQDGYQVVPNHQPFQKSTLDGFQVLVVANAMGPGFRSCRARGIPPSPTRSATPSAIGFVKAAPSCSLPTTNPREQRPRSWPDGLTCT